MSHGVNAKGALQQHEVTVTVPTLNLPDQVQKAIDGIRKPFLAFTAEHAKLGVKRADLAPKLMMAFGQWQGTGGTSFVAFIRLLDPSLPIARDEYRAHASYQAAEYLRRLVTGGSTSGRERPKPIRSTLTTTARILGSLLPYISNLDEVWAAMGREFGYTPKQITRLRAAVSEVRPFAELPIAKPIKATLIHVESTPITATTEPQAEKPRKRTRAAA